MEVIPADKWNSIPLGNSRVRLIPTKRQGSWGIYTPVNPCLKAISRHIHSLAPPANCMRAAEMVWWPEKALWQGKAAREKKQQGKVGLIEAVVVGTREYSRGTNSIYHSDG